MTLKRLPFLLICLLFLVSACQQNNNQPAIQVGDVWARAASAMAEQNSGSEQGNEHKAMGANSAAYMILRNLTEKNDRLLKVDCDTAQAVELHKSEMQDGVMRMQPVQGIDIPAKGEVKLEPGGLHVMLIGLHEDLVAGQILTLTLVFETAGEMVVEAEIRAP